MIGVDLVYIPEFQARLATGGTALLETMFVLSEVRRRDAEHLSGVWAAKEAICKAVGQPPTAWNDIHITYDAAGKPSGQWNDRLFDVSISHQGDYAVAVALEKGVTS